MPQTEIEVHFSQMKVLSQELQDVAERLKRTADILGMESISEIRKAWESVYTDRFIKKEIKLLEKIGETAVDLGDISVEICDKAKRLYESEQKNALAAKIRSYS